MGDYTQLVRKDWITRLWIVCGVLVAAAMTLGRALPERGFLAYSGPGATLFLMDMRTRLIHDATPDGFFVQYPHVSRDGAHVVYRTDVSGGTHWLAVTSLPSGDFRLLAPSHFGVGDQTWLDGEVFFTTRTGTGTMQLWVHDTRTDEQRRFTRSEVTEGLGRPAPDGTRALVQVPGPRPQTATLHVTNGQWMKPVFNGDLFVPDAEWSPDGRYVAAAIETDGYAIYLADLETGTRRQVSTAPLTGDPVFSPDGRYLAYVSRRFINGMSKDITLHILDLETERTRQIRVGLDVFDTLSWGSTAGW